MWKVSASLLFAATVLLTNVGCKYDGSFMQMDSNSGAPFFGLQWAVDSGSRPPLPQSISTPEHSAGSRDSSIRLRTEGLWLQTPADHLRSPVKAPASLVTVSHRSPQ